MDSHHDDLCVPKTSARCGGGLIQSADRVIGLLWFVLVSPFRSKARLEAEIATL